MIFKGNLNIEPISYKEFAKKYPDLVPFMNDLEDGNKSFEEMLGLFDKLIEEKSYYISQLSKIASATIWSKDYCRQVAKEAIKKALEE